MKVKILFLFISIGVFAQTDKTLTFDKNIELVPSEKIELPSDKLITDYSFSKLTIKDLSYLLLGETSPSEGLEATFNEDKNKISLSGGICSGKSYLYTVKGEFITTDEKVYFFDENKGSTNAKVSINYFQSLWASRKYDEPEDAQNVQRGFYKIEIAKRVKIANLLRDYYYSWALLEHSRIPVENSDTLIKKFREDIERYNYLLELGDSDFATEVDTAKVNAFIKEKALGIKMPEIFQPIVIIDKKDGYERNIPKKVEKPKKVHSLKLSSFVIDKAIALYEKTLTSMDSITNKLSETEIEQAQSYWNSKKLVYIGISPFYERETIKNVYTFNESLPFDDQFKDAQGDLFGVDLQAGYFYQAKKRNCLTKMFYTRITGQIARGSNTNMFKKRTYEFPSTSLDSLSTGIITTPNKTEGHYNGEGNVYKFGFKTSIGLENYWYPSTHFGLFGQIGYSHVAYDVDEVKDSEIYNLRLGVLINLKAKEKNFATLQFFVDRSDLSKSPNGNDEDDLRFGFKLGIPFYFKSKL